MAERRYRITVRREARWRWCWEISSNYGSDWAWWTGPYGYSWTEERAWRAADRALAKERRRNAREDAAKASERTREVGS